MNIPEAINKFLATKNTAKVLGISRSSDAMLVSRHATLSGEGARMVHLLKVASSGHDQGINY